jgi:integrase/recombinase XerD
MLKDRSRDINPNRVHGCHPPELNNLLRPLFRPNIKAPPKAPPAISQRLLVLERILKGISASDFPGKDHFAEHMHWRYRYNCKASTLRSAAASIKQFLLFYRQTGKHHIEQMTREDLEAYTEDMQDRGLKPNTVSCKLRIIYAFIRFLIEGKVLGYELLERKIKIRLPERLPRAIDPEDLKLLLAIIDKVRDRALILLLLRTGMRIGELLSTKVHDVDLNNQRILIYAADKNGVGRVAYYSDDAQEALLTWLSARDTLKEYLFYSQQRDTLSYEAVRCTFNKYLDKAGLAYSGYTLHCLRHTFATELLNARMPLECLRVLLGHSSLEVTRIYARLTDKTREHEYFTAMERILKGDTDAVDPCDY